MLARSLSAALNSSSSYPRFAPLPPLPLVPLDAALRTLGLSGAGAATGSDAWGTSRVAGSPGSTRITEPPRPRPLAITPSATSPTSAARSNRSSIGPSCPGRAGISTSTVHSGIGSMGNRVSSPVSARKSKPARCISSKAVTPPPDRSCARASRDSAARGEGTARSAAPSAAGRGCSRRAAAVMMPRVPSDPISRCRRS